MRLADSIIILNLAESGQQWQICIAVRDVPAAG